MPSTEFQWHLTGSCPVWVPTFWVITPMFSLTPFYNLFFRLCPKLTSGARLTRLYLTVSKQTASSFKECSLCFMLFSGIITCPVSTSRHLPPLSELFAPGLPARGLPVQAESPFPSVTATDVISNCLSS